MSNKYTKELAAQSIIETEIIKMYEIRCSTSFLLSSVYYCGLTDLFIRRIPLNKTKTEMKSVRVPKVVKMQKGMVFFQNAHPRTANKTMIKITVTLRTYKLELWRSGDSFWVISCSRQDKA